MPYAVQADLNLDDSRLLELTENASNIGAIDTALLARLETESESIVNGVIGGSITLPFVSTPPMITFVTACIWKRRLYAHREVMQIPVTVESDYKFAMDLLAKIAAGEIELITGTPNLAGVPEVESSCARGWTPRDLVVG